MAFWLRPLTVVCGVLLVAGCGGSNTADALIGPEGGVVAHDDGVTLTVPAGALLVTRQIIIRPSDEKLSRGSYEQVGESYLIEPRDLEFRVPAELTFDTKVAERPSVLLKPGETRVIAYSASDDKPTAYIGSLGVVAAAKGGDVAGTVDDPVLSRTPTDTDISKPAVDVAQLKISPKGVTTLDVGFTAFDTSGMSRGLLNGEGTAYCGFKFGSVLGASISGGCSLGLTSGTLALTSGQATVDVLPFLIGKLERPVVVEVQLGSGDLVVSAGYFPFITSGCFLESCSGHGVCMDTGGAAACMCDEGFAPGMEPLSCDCVPKCDGKQCGNDSCGGQCQPGCDNATHTCNQETAQCDPLPPPESTGEPETSSTGPDPGTTTTGEPGTTTDEPNTSTTTGDPSTSSTTSTSTTTDGTTSGTTGGESTGSTT